jgi:multidrug efflux pump subunit AcrB
MDNKKSYLSRLKFDPKLLSSFKAKYLTNIRIVILFVLIIVIAGVTSFLTLPRRLNPEVKIPIVRITTILPGASPKDVEDLITNPIEDAVKGTKGITSIVSSSNESLSTVVAEFSSNISPEKAEADLKSAVDTVTDLPQDATDPIVRKFDFEDQPVWIFAVKSDDPASLLRFSKILRDKLEDNPNLDRVTISGLEEQEVQIIADPEKIARFGTNPITLSRTIQSLLSSYPAGNINSSTLAFPLGINPSISSTNDLRNTVLTTDGTVIKLADIATVMERAKPGIQKSFIASRNKKGEVVATFSVFKNTTATIDKSTQQARKIAEDAIKPYGNTFEIITVTDSSKLIDEEFGNLTNSFRDTLILVFITFLIFLGIRQALIAVLTIPLTFLVTFTVINSIGLSLNFLTLFSLLLSLGLLVDDTIVVVTGMTSYYRTRKFTPQQTGLLVWRDLIVPIWSTTITTSWAFLPLLLSTGIIGEFIKTIPIVVATTLYASTAIAVLITIPLMIVILKLEMPRRVIVLLKIVTILLVGFLLILLLKGNPLTILILLLVGTLAVVTFRVRSVLSEKIVETVGKKSVINSKKVLTHFNERLIDIEHFALYYKRIIFRIITSKNARRKVLAAVIIFSVFSYLLVPFGFVTNEFFPKSEYDYIYVNLELPSGTNTDTATRSALDLLDKLRITEGVTYVSAEMGRGVDAGAQDYKSGSNLVLYTLALPEKENRKIDSLEISDKLRVDLKKVKSDGNISVVELSGGPPAGAEVQVQLLGDDLAKLDEYADNLIVFLKSKQGIINVTKSINPGTSKLTFVPDAAKVANAGLTQDSLGIWLRTFTTGLTFKSVKFGEKDSKDIVFRMDNDTQSPEDLSRLQIPNNNNEYIPLLSLGKLQLETNPTAITHLDTKRTISVSAGVSKGYSVTKANQELLAYVDSLKLPEGYSYKTGGVNEENQKSVNSILQAMMLAGLLILATMVIQFRSYRKALIVMLVIPLAVSGVFIVFALTGTPLSFPALIGVLSLFGIVVTHAMFLVDKINRNISVGMPFNEAVSDGAASRLEPVFIGSFTTIVGLIPISLSNPLWRGLGGAIIAGLSFSGIIMLFFIPVMYSIIYRRDYGKSGKIRVD